MASPLNFKGGIQLTESDSVHTPLLRFKKNAPSIITDSNPPTPIFAAKLYLKSDSFSTVVDSVLSNHIALQFGGMNLALTKYYVPPVTGYDKTKMFMVFF